MASAEQKIVQYLNEAHATERALTRVLQEQIAIAPRGRHRDGLESHLVQTRDHTRRLERRLKELGQRRNPLELGVGLLQSVVGQALALGKAPFDILRGSGGEEKVLKNAKDACASEALETATYTALEDLARSAGDEPTAKLAASIRADEQKMLDRLLAEIPRLTEAVIAADVRGNGSYDISESGAADAAKAARRRVAKGARGKAAGARRTARKARKVPGVAQAEGQIKGAVASEGDLPIANYGKLTAAEIVEKLTGLSQVDLAKVDSYERRNDNRTVILSRLASLRTSEPWPGYDELDVDEVQKVVHAGDSGRARRIGTYERSHKNRGGVLAAVERETSHA